MKNLFLLSFALITAIGLQAQTQIWVQDFETAGTGYALQNNAGGVGAECSDSNTDFVTRTDGSDLNAIYNVGNTSGNFFFAIMDMDDGVCSGQYNAPDVVTMTFMDDISIAGFNTLDFRLDIAEDDDGGNQDWDADAAFSVQIDIDNSGTFTEIFHVGAAGTNTEPTISEPAFFSGLPITSTFQNFEIPVTGVGSVMDIRIVVSNLNAGDEDVAFDNLALFGIAAGANPLVTLSADVNAGSEDAGTVVTLTANTTAAVTGAQTVDVAISGTGITGTDGTLSSASITIADGMTSGSVTYTILDDADSEGTETAIATISNPSGGIDLGGTLTQDIVITDNDFPVILVSDTSIDGLTYVETMGPSSNYMPLPTLGWANLNFGQGVAASNPINNFEFSADGVTYSVLDNILAGSAQIGDVPPTPVFVRMIAGLAVGTYNESVTLTSMSGAIPVTITFEGEVTALPAGPCEELFISEYGEPNSGNGKYVELYNPSADTIFLTDYALWRISNGGSWPEATLALSGAVPPAGTFVVANNATDVPGSDQNSSGYASFNGDDAVGLVKNGELIDQIGTDGPDPGDGFTVAGVANATLNGVIIRKASVQSGNTDWAASAGTNTTDSEWTVIAYSQSNVGAHASSCNATACSVDMITAGMQTACDPMTNTYTQEITVSYTDDPGTGDLVVNGQNFAIGTSPQTVTLVGLTANGLDVDVTAAFSDDLGCTLTATALFTAAADCTPTIADCSELFFSEYIEGGVNNKCLEIYNPTAGNIDLAAGNYTIARYNNGSNTNSGQNTLSGIIPAYGTYVICNGGATSDFTDEADLVGGPITFYNGDDVVALFANGVLIDVIGEIGNGANFSSNVTLVRNANILAGDNNGMDAFNTADEWTALPQDDFSNLGQHGNDCSPTPLVANDVVCGAMTLPASANNAGFSTYTFFGGVNCKTITGDNSFATAGGEPTGACGGTGGKSLWYKFNIPGCDVGGVSPFDIVISTDNAGTTIDTKVDVFSSDDGSCGGVLTSLGCNVDKMMDGCSGNASATTSTVSVNGLMTGVDYFVRVDGNNGEIGSIELSISILPNSPTVVADATNGRLDISQPDYGANLYTFYWRKLGNAGYVILNKTVPTHNTGVAFGETYLTQILNRCTGVWYRTAIDTTVMPAAPSACTPVTVSCVSSDATSLTVSWDERTGLYTGAGGNLSGYILYWNETGTPGYSYLSNPQPVCANGTCTYTINNVNGFNPYDVWVRTRCSATKTTISEVQTCGVESRGDSEETLYTFSSNGSQYVDVKLTDDWNDFGVKLPETGSGFLDFSNGSVVVLDKEGGNPISTIASDEALSINLIPNPANSVVQIAVDGTATNYVVYDLQGKALMNGAFNAGSTNVNVNIAGLNTGVYIVKVSSNTNTTTAKLIVNK